MEPEQAGTLVKRITAPPADHHSKPRLRHLPGKAWRYALRRSVHNFLVDIDMDVAGTLTYYAVLSIFPALLALLTVVSLIGEQQATARWLLEFAARYLNADVVDLLREPITLLTQAQHAGWVLVVSLAIALWSANGYVSAFGRAMNRVFEVTEGRPPWKIIPYNLMLTAGTLIGGGITLVAMVLSNRLLLTVNGGTLGPRNQVRTLLDQWDAARWPILLVTAVIYTTALYHLTPNVQQGRFRWVTPGSVVAIGGIVLAALGFNFYLDRFSTLNATYGVVGSFIVLLLGLWLMNCALVFGGELDSELERARELLAGIEAERHLQLPPRDIAMIRSVIAAEEKFVDQGRRLRESGGGRPTTEPTRGEPGRIT
jgi:membrane protein